MAANRNPLIADTVAPQCEEMIPPLPAARLAFELRAEISRWRLNLRYARRWTTLQRGSPSLLRF